MAMTFLRALGIGVFVVATVGLSGAAYADPIGPNCGTCQGGIYTLTYNPTPEAILGSGNKVWDVTLTIDTSGYNGGGTQLRAVAIKATSTDQTTADSGLDSTNASGTWVFQAGGIDSGGCNGKGSGFECAHGVTTVPTATVYHWTFDVVTGPGGLDTGAGAASIKAQYTNSTGTKVGDLVSEDITLQLQAVPEPTALLLVGSALAGIGLWGRKRWLERKTA